MKELHVAADILVGSECSATVIGAVAPGPSWGDLKALACGAEGFYVAGPSPLVARWATEPYGG